MRATQVLLYFPHGNYIRSLDDTTEICLSTVETNEKINKLSIQQKIKYNKEMWYPYINQQKYCSLLEIGGMGFVLVGVEKNYLQ